MTRSGAAARELLGAIEGVYIVDSPRREPMIQSLFPGVEVLAPRNYGWSGAGQLITVGEWTRIIRDRTVIVWTTADPKIGTIHQMRRVGRIALERGAAHAFGQIHIATPRRIYLDREPHDPHRRTSEDQLALDLDRRGPR